MGPLKRARAFEMKNQGTQRATAISTYCGRCGYSVPSESCSKTNGKPGGNIWRPWIDDTRKELQSRLRKQEEDRVESHHANFIPSDIRRMFKHPVRLCWPKRPYDYLYQDGVLLLKNFPVQATLEFVPELDNSDSEEELDNSSEE